LSRFLGRKVLRARRLTQPAQPAPHVELPAQAEPELCVAHAGVHTLRDPPGRAYLRIAERRHAAGHIDGRELIGARDPIGRPRLQHALCGDPQLEVLLQRRVDHLGQPVVVEQLEPLHVGQRRCARLSGSTVGRRQLHRRPLVIGADRARGRHEAASNVTATRTNGDTVISSDHAQRRWQSHAAGRASRSPWR
jgi:hypothetical protein